MSRLAPCMWLIAFLMLAACSNGRGSLEEPQPSASSPAPTEPAPSPAPTEPTPSPTPTEPTPSPSPTDPTPTPTPTPSPPPSAPAQVTFTIGGTVTGLTGTGLVLQNNGAGNLAITKDGPFAFAATAASGTAYRVSVATQPSAPSQVCTVTNGAGAVGSANVTNILVSCSAAPRFSISGTVSGLAGSGLVLQNNGTDDLPIGANGGFTFPTSLLDAATYSVTVKNQPAGQNCVIQNPSGTIAAANVTNVTVTCAANQFTVGGTVSGLEGSGLILRLNGGNDLRVVSNGPFAFPSPVADGTSYVVTAHAQPRDPRQDCAVTQGTGAIAGANVATIAITCTTLSFTVGGTIRGLAGQGLVLTLNGTNDLAIAADGAYKFAQSLLSGTSYTVRIKTNPSQPAQICTVANAVGTVRDREVSHVNVSCATQTYSIGGSVSGLLGTGLTLLNNGSDRIEIASNGGFVFPTQLASGSAYNITVGTPPANPTQACTVTNGTGTLTDTSINNVAVTCSTSNFTIGGTVQGVAGTGVTLRNGAETITITGSGPFTFPTAVPSGTPYTIDIAQQPSTPSQTCSMTNGAGTVTDAAITNILVDCVTNGFTVGGQVSGLSGSGLILQNNGADNLEIAADGAFSFPTALPSGTPYNVTVASQPDAPRQVCTVSNGVGTVDAANIESVAISCQSTWPF